MSLDLVQHRPSLELDPFLNQGEEFASSTVQDAPQTVTVDVFWLERYPFGDLDVTSQPLGTQNKRRCSPSAGTDTSRNRHSPELILEQYEAGTHAAKATKAAVSQP